MAQKNSTILSKIWLTGTNDFQQRIPNPDVAGISATTQALFSPMNGQYWNQFVDALMYRVGTTIVHTNEWNNPLRGFKRDIGFGNTIQEIGIEWVRAHSYDLHSDVLDVHKPEAQEWFHSINFARKYEISVQIPELRKAFESEYGLNQFVAGVLQSPVNSDNYDEYRQMMELIAFYQDKWGFYTYHLQDAATTESGAKELLTKVKEFTGLLKFPTTLYNNVPGIPVFANPDDLMLMTTPAYEANLDVNVLASLFHVELADIDVNRIIVDEFPIPGAVALLTTRGFFIQADSVYQTTSFYDPSNLVTNYFLHHQGVSSVSPYVPAILFTEGEGAASTTITTVTQSVTGLSLTVDDSSIAAGATTQTHAYLQGTISPADEEIDVAPDACTYIVTCSRTDDVTPTKLNTRTYVDRDGILHTQKTLKAGDVLTITAMSAYTNPSGETPKDLAATATVTIS